MCDLILPRLPRPAGVSRVSADFITDPSSDTEAIFTAVLDEYNGTNSATSTESFFDSMMRASKGCTLPPAIRGKYWFLVPYRHQGRNRAEIRLDQKRYAPWTIMFGEKTEERMTWGQLILMRDNKWEKRTNINPAEDSIVAHLLQDASALLRRLSWNITFRRSPSHLGMVYHTDNQGVLALLKDRWVEPGHRKTPLLHWVQNHTRKNRGGNISDVREHVRGNRTCEWHGYLCEIRESEAEREVLVNRV